jgi:hypothetical protein
MMLISMKTERRKDIHDAQEYLALAQAAGKNCMNAVELDIHGSDPVPAAEKEAGGGEIGIKRRETQMYSEEQVQILLWELIRGGLRMKNA